MKNQFVAAGVITRKLRTGWLLPRCSRVNRNDRKIMKQSLIFSIMLVILLITGSLHAADQSRDIFLDVRQIVFLKKGESKKNQILVNDPDKIKQLVTVLELVKSDRRVCDMEWEVTFIKKAGRVETGVCRHCFEIRNKNGTERFQMPPEFYKMAQQIEKQAVPN